ncbi:hypothetical protein [Paludibacter sp.]|uniref:hypothetical protein n=1 Tax=Paludibacter sp. TaxID=1898105 RepID=UPI00135232D6|nr:hypothetical protein [Paludibacter sp.]MTK53306.1 hypothetical protein [Paludibacter sp.]
MATDKNTLIGWFVKGAKPLASQFAAWINSYWHKDEQIPVSSIEGLQNEFDKKENVGVAASLVSEEATARQQADETLQTNINAKANSSDVYTKTEVNNKLASVYKFKGNVADEASLPSADQEVGDVYNCADTGMNFAWNGTAWDALGEFATGFVSYLNYQNLTTEQKMNAIWNTGTFPKMVRASMNGNVCTESSFMPDDILFQTLNVYLNGVLQFPGLDYDIDTTDTTKIKVVFKGTSPANNLSMTDIVVFKFLGGTPSGL